MRVRNNNNNSNNNGTNVKVHNIVILDGSGSMSGTKYTNAKKGVWKEIDLCKDLNYSFTLIEFVRAGKIIEHFYKVSPNTIKNIDFGGANGSDTPLYQTIVETIDKLLKSASTSDRFLIKIITDGQNNVGTKSEIHALESIKKAEKNGCTVTFTCVEYDKKYILEIGVDESNIITYDNTGKDLERTMNETRSATILYSKNLSEGKDVTLGFYSKTVTN